MAGLGASNLNLNLNLASVDVPRTAGALTRIRYNTADYRKLVNLAAPLVPDPTVYNALTFLPSWDANLRSYVFLSDFIKTATTTWGAWWVDHLKTHVDATYTAPNKLPAADLENQVLTILDKAADRDDRFMEIIDQHDAEGAINYWLGMLMIDPARHPATYLLVRIAARIGEAAVMCLKQAYLCPRPSQICPAIVPMLDPPCTPSFPAGHALQARLISKVLDAVDQGHAKPHVPQRALLLNLSDRIADNRVIAGLHFPVDNEAGIAAADECFTVLWNNQTAELQAVVAAARNER
jgi:hypothetical protein